jgi:hypothetical protein
VIKVITSNKELFIQDKKEGKGEIFMEKEIENSQVEQLEDTFYIKHREERMKKVKEFVKEHLFWLIQKIAFVYLFQFPLATLASDSPNAAPSKPGNGKNSSNDKNSSLMLYLLANACTALYDLWRNSPLQEMSFREFMNECLKFGIYLIDKTSQCPAPPPAGGPKPGGPPPAFLNSLKSSPYAMGGSILLITFLFVSASLNSKEKEEKK